MGIASIVAVSGSGEMGMLFERRFARVGWDVNVFDRVCEVGTGSFAIMVASYIAEILWTRFGYGATIAFVDFPAFEEKWLKDDEIELTVQIGGKGRALIMVAAVVAQVVIVVGGNV